MWGEHKKKKKGTKQQTEGLRPDPIPLPPQAPAEGWASTDEVGQTRPAVQRSET